MVKLNCIKNTIYIDEGISGTNTKKRKEFNRMIADAKSGAFDLIITKEISRFARNTLDSIFYTRDLKKHGVGVIFMNDNINTLDGDSELRLAIMSSIAQEESRRTSERVKWGQKRQMERGVVFGRSMLGYDVKDGRMYINEEGAKIVRLIFYKFVNEKKGTYVIAHELQEAGIFPMYVKKWQNTVILRILRNEKYCGDLVQKKTYTPDFLSHEKKYNQGQEEFVILKDHHMPIISRELFNEANRILDAKSHSQKGKSKYSNRYLFSGKIKCGRCGASYTARYKNRKDGSRYKAWRCFERVKYGSPYIDKAGNQIGCLGTSIRNEEVISIMYLVCKQLNINRQKISDNLIKIINKVISMDITGTGNIEKQQILQKQRILQEQQILLKRQPLQGQQVLQEQQILSERQPLQEQWIPQEQQILPEQQLLQEQRIPQEQQILSERQPLQEQQVLQKQQILQKQERLKNIKEVIDELIGGVCYEDEYYAQILDKMVVNDKDHIDVYLKMLPHKWSYTTAENFL